MKVSNRKPKIVILSGAGLSADSGIRTYRGVDGIYNGIRAEDVMSRKTMRERPEIIQRFCDDRRVELGGVEPNAAHHMIKRLADRYGDLVIHLTQNIDDLMERAGHLDTLHLHGELRVLRSIGNSNIEVDIGFRRYWDGDISVMPEAGFRFRCPRSGSLFRPAVVLFHEPAPVYMTLHKVMRNLRRDDILIVIGTQGTVLDIQTFVQIAPCRTILNNLHDSPDIDPDAFWNYFKMRATDAAPNIEEIVDTHMRKFGL